MIVFLKLKLFDDGFLLIVDVLSHDIGRRDLIFVENTVVHLQVLLLQHLVGGGIFEVLKPIAVHLL